MNSKTKKQKGIQSQEAFVDSRTPRTSNILYFPPARIQDKLRHRIGTRNDEERKKKDSGELQLENSFEAGRD